LLLTAFSARATAEDFTEAIHAYLQQRIEAEKKAVGIVVGLVDEQGSRVISYWRMGDGTDREVDGDTVFELGSATKTFTTLLLQDMVERGRMKLDDPVAKYLPKSLKMPTRNGKEITLRQLAAHTSGLPKIPDNLDSKRADNPYADYTVEKLYAFLSRYELPRNPGVSSEYSNLGTGLLGHVVALKAGTSYEALVVDRICRPLKMNSTRITLTAELKGRFVTAHNRFGEAVRSWDVPTLAGAGALRSTAHDMLKYVSANLGLTPSRLARSMKKTHDLGLGWYAVLDEPGTRIIGHGGGTGGCRSFAGFDKERRRGVVIVFNAEHVLDVEALGKFLLRSEWQADRRPMEIKIDAQVYDSYVGQYQASHAGGVPSRPRIGIRRQGDRLFAQATESDSESVDVFLPPIAGEFVPQSETRLFERLSGTPMTFTQDAQAKVAHLTVHRHGRTLVYEKISDQPLPAPEPLQPRVAINLPTPLLDACAGHYEFAPTGAFPAGMRVRIWREGDQLLAQAWIQDATQGAFEIYPESDMIFFDRISDTRSIFRKNDKGEVTAVILQAEGQPDCEGNKMQ